MYVLEIIDKTKRKIYLTKERLLHINKDHPEVFAYFNEFGEVLSKPTKIVDHEDDKNIKYYYKYFKKRKTKTKYLLVIVKYLNGEGFIITAYFVKNIK